MTDSQISLQTLLQEHHLRIRTRNPHFSVRAFAKRLGIPSGTLSLLMLGKRRASRKLAAKICEKLLLGPLETNDVLSLFPARKRAGLPQGEPLHYLQISADQHQIISEWQYFAILNLIEVKNFRNDSAWIAGRLGLSMARVTDALERLHRAGFVREERGTLVRCAPKYRTPDHVAHLSVRKAHHENLELARESLERDSVDARDFTALTVPMDLARLPAAKELIRKFQDDLASLLECPTPHPAVPTEVYRLAVQLFPLTCPETLGDES